MSHCCVCVCVSHHGVTQYVGGLSEFVFWNAAVEQNGLQQTRVVQVNGVVSVLKPDTAHQTHPYRHETCVI